MKPVKFSVLLIIIIISCQITFGQKRYLGFNVGYAYNTIYSDIKNTEISPVLGICGNLSLIYNHYSNISGVYEISYLKKGANIKHNISEYYGPDSYYELKNKQHSIALTALARLKTKNFSNNIFICGGLQSGAYIFGESSSYAQIAGYKVDASKFINAEVLPFFIDLIIGTGFMLADFNFELRCSAGILNYFKSSESINVYKSLGFNLNLGYYFRIKNKKSPFYRRKF